jgi:hypothetical protein
MAAFDPERTFGASVRGCVFNRNDVWNGNFPDAAALRGIPVSFRRLLVPFRTAVNSVYFHMAGTRTELARVPQCHSFL